MIKPLYPHSAEDARSRGELERWRASFRENCACAAAIDEAIRAGFDGMHLKGEPAREIIDRFGYRRTQFVLANTLQQMRYDGRFSPSNRDWGAQMYVPDEPRHRLSFLLKSHPAVLDGFIREFRQEMDALQLFDRSHAEDGLGQDYTNRVLVLKPFILKEPFYQPQYQLWYARSGFGCAPDKLGAAVFATCLSDGEHARWSRNDFYGPIRVEYLPDWARQNLERLQSG